MRPLAELETVALRDPDIDARVVLSPARGGIVTRFSVAGRPVLFMDDATLADETKNIRGGVPVLFPSPGPLAGERFSRGGASGSMKQHGFARQRPWTVTAQTEREVTLALVADEVTRAQFPWEFALTFRYVLRGARLRIEQRLENRGPAAMPFAMGFHPYFYVPDGEKARASIATPAARAWDNAAKRAIVIDGPIDLTRPEVDLHLEDHGRSDATLALADGARIEVSGSPEYWRWVVWTLAGKDFVCLEPWTAAGDALNTGEHLLEVAAGGARELWTEIAFVAP